MKRAAQVAATAEELFTQIWKEGPAYTVGEAALVLRLGRGTVYNLVRAGTLRAVPVGTAKVLIDRRSLRTLLGGGATGAEGGAR